MTLCITLRDGEQMIVNGAVLRASRRAELIVENRAAILRGREVMTPADATTPARRLYLACMMAYIDEPGRVGHQNNVVDLLGDLLGAFGGIAARKSCIDFAKLAAIGDYYRALAVCRTLIDHETAAFARLQDEAA